jgi:hypothetical protein
MISRLGFTSAKWSDYRTLRPPRNFKDHGSEFIHVARVNSLLTLFAIGGFKDPSFISLATVNPLHRQFISPTVSVFKRSVGLVFVQAQKRIPAQSLRSAFHFRLHHCPFDRLLAPKPTRWPLKEEWAVSARSPSHKASHTLPVRPSGVVSRTVPRPLSISRPLLLSFMARPAHRPLPLSFRLRPHSRLGRQRPRSLCPLLRQLIQPL